MKTVIGLAGVKTSGKSTVANIIKELIPNVKEAALADKLKNTCAEVFDVPREYFDRQDLKEAPFKEGPKKLTAFKICQILESFDFHMSIREVDSAYDIIGMELPTPRKIAQIVGTEVLRAAGDEDIHCKNIDINDEGITIVSDLRFPNEFEYFYKADDVTFLPVYVQRDEAEQCVTEDSHPSETSVFKFTNMCYEVNNNRSLQDLNREVAALLVQTGFLEDMPKQA
jgi:hypothetical protein